MYIVLPPPTHKERTQFHFVMASLHDKSSCGFTAELSFQTPRKLNVKEVIWAEMLCYFHSVLLNFTAAEFIGAKSREKLCRIFPSLTRCCYSNATGHNRREHNWVNKKIAVWLGILSHTHTHTQTLLLNCGSTESLKRNKLMKEAWTKCWYP